MLPAILLGSVGAAVGAAITYYFVSNNANAKREELTKEIEATLRVVLEKAEALKEAVRAREDALRAASESNAQMAAEVEALRQELTRTEKEVDNLQAEVLRWRENPKSLVGRVVLVAGSSLLRQVGWKHENAITSLVERQHHAKGALFTLGSTKRKRETHGNERKSKTMGSEALSREGSGQAVRGERGR